MEEIICKKCNIRFNNLKQLTKHINDYHIFSVKEYYDMYLKQEGEGICLVCGKETNFKSTRYGYYKTCSHKCHTYLQNKLYSAKEKNKINEKRKNTWNKKDLTEYKNIQHNIQKQRYDSYSDEKKKEIANSISNSLQNRSEEEKLISNKKISDSLKHYYLENPEEKEKISKRVSIWLLNHWKNLSNEDRKIELEKVDKRLHHFSDERKKNK